jgi:nucleoside phosphorylase
MRHAVIFTAKSTETPAVKKQLIGPIGPPRITDIAVYSVWHLRAAVDQDAVVKDLEVALYETGRGQDEVWRSVHAVVTHFKADVVLYLGCAGGEASELKVNEILVATEAWPYEKGKETPRGFLSRAHPLPPTRLMKDYAIAVSERSEWRKRIPADFPGESEVKFGGLASGNKVLATEKGKTWKHVKKKLSDEIIGVETEAYAFFKAMTDLNRPYLMIRGISDNLINKNTEGKNKDDDRQTRATAHAAAFAAELLMKIDYDQLERARGVNTAQVKEHLALSGFWSSSWSYGPQNCKDLIEIEIDGVSGDVMGRRVSLTLPHELRYIVSGQAYHDYLHLLAIDASRARPLFASFILKAENQFRESLSGIATRPLGTGSMPKFTGSVLTHEKLFWASPVTYKRITDPATECPDLWRAYSAP